jgi:hypothetical protein
MTSAPVYTCPCPGPLHYVPWLPCTCAQVLQRYFTPQSAAMAEYALASAVVRRVKNHHARAGGNAAGDAPSLSPVQSLSGHEGARRSTLLLFNQSCLSWHGCCRPHLHLTLGPARWFP